jgi:hypothetical protein
MRLCSKYNIKREKFYISIKKTLWFSYQMEDNQWLHAKQKLFLQLYKKMNLY